MSIAGISFFCVYDEAFLVSDLEQDVISILYNLELASLLPWVLGKQDYLYYLVPRDIVRMVLQVMVSGHDVTEIYHLTTPL